MKPATQRIIDALINGNELKEQQLGVLLCLIQHLNTTKGATLGEIHSALAIVYMNPAQAQDDALSTHLTWGE